MKKHKDEMRDILFPVASGYLRGDAELEFRIQQGLPRSRKTAQFIQQQGSNILRLEYRHPIQTVEPEHHQHDYDFLNDQDSLDLPSLSPPLASVSLQPLSAPVLQTSPELDDDTAARLQNVFENEIDDFEYQLTSNRQFAYNGTMKGQSFLDCITGIRRDKPEIPMNSIKLVADRIADFFVQNFDIDSEYAKEFKRIANSSYFINKNTEKCISICHKESLRGETLKTYFANIQEILARFLNCNRLVKELFKEKESKLLLNKI